MSLTTITFAFLKMLKVVCNSQSVRFASAKLVNRQDLKSCGYNTLVGSSPTARTILKKLLDMKYILLLFFLLLIEKSTFSNNLDKEIERFILNNPEVILKSLENYEIKREKEENDKVKEAVKSFNNLIYDDSNGLYAGEKNSKISIVKFSDYNCSYCKKAHKDILKVKKNFPNVKIKYKNFPILSLYQKTNRI